MTKLKPMNVVSQVTIKGSQDGYILTIEDSVGFKDDMALTLSELVQIYNILKHRFEKKQTTQKDAIQADKFKARRTLKATSKGKVGKLSPQGKNTGKAKGNRNKKG